MVAIGIDARPFLLIAQADKALNQLVGDAARATPELLKAAFDGLPSVLSINLYPAASGVSLLQAKGHIAQALIHFTKNPNLSDLTRAALQRGVVETRLEEPTLSKLCTWIDEQIDGALPERRRFMSLVAEELEVAYRSMNRQVPPLLLSYRQAEHSMQALIAGAQMSAQEGSPMNEQFIAAASQAIKGLGPLADAPIIAFLKPQLLGFQLEVFAIRIEVETGKLSPLEALKRFQSLVEKVDEMGEGTMREFDALVGLTRLGPPVPKF